MPIQNSKLERHFLKGPSSRWSELVHVLQITAEFIRGFRKLHFVGPCITVFGSARFKEGHPYYEQAREFGREIVKSDFSSGLHFKLPFVNNVEKYPSRILTLINPQELFLTFEKKNLFVDFFVKWRIVDIDDYYNATRGDESPPVT